MLFFVLLNEVGYGPIPWLLEGEMIPMAVKGLGAGLAIFSYSIFSFLIGLTYPEMDLYLSPYVTFWIYSGLGLLGVPMAYLLPETKGKSMVEIEQYFEPKSEFRNF